MVTGKVIKICEENTSNLVIYIDNDIIMKEMNEDIFPIYNQVTYGIVEIGHWGTIKDRLAEVNKCLVIEQHDPQNLVNIEKKFNQELGKQSDIIFTSKKLLEVLPKGVTKVTGIQRLIATQGIKMSEVMAFGDYDNDIEMLNAVGLGVVVENGSPAAKASADLIIGSCDQNGPAKFLEKLIKSL
jgi:hydroxymethylpyrimidine pyrophosphatase-like HAD family hydrolase